MISDRISEDKPPQMKILNTVIPILMHFCSVVLNWSLCKLHKATQHPMKCDVINDVKLFPTVPYITGYTVTILLSQIFDSIQSDITLQKQVHLNGYYFKFLMKQTVVERVDWILWLG